MGGGLAHAVEIPRAPEDGLRRAECGGRRRCQAVVAHAYPVLVAHARATHMRARRSEELDAWWLAYEGMLAWEQRERAPNAEARANLEAAIAREPEFVLAH